MRGWRRWAGWAGGVLLAGSVSVPMSHAQDAQTWLTTMLAHEDAASGQSGRYLYTNEEKSERTGGHVWVERVAETEWGKVRLLLTEDGQPLNPQRMAAERARLEDEAAHPDVFKRTEMARTDGDQHARDMLGLLPQAFLLDPPQIDGGVVVINYRPNPGYKPQTLEQKVLHAMTGTVYLDQKQVRMKEVNGHTTEDVSVGFGLASVKAGSNFDSKRVHAEGPDWKLQSLHADVKGKAFFLKIARAQDSLHTDFHKIPDHLTVAEAVGLLESK